MRKRGMLGAFIAMLGSLGGSFEPVETKDGERKARSGRRAASWARWLDVADSDDYRRDSRGIIIRISPKRDKSISARQWKKRVKQQRREAKVAA